MFGTFCNINSSIMPLYLFVCCKILCADLTWCTNLTKWTRKCHLYILRVVNGHHVAKTSNKFSSTGLDHHCLWSPFCSQPGWGLLGNGEKFTRNCLDWGRETNIFLVQLLLHKVWFYLIFFPPEAQHGIRNDSGQCCWDVPSQNRTPVTALDCSPVKQVNSKKGININAHIHKPS